MNGGQNPTPDDGVDQKCETIPVLQNCSVLVVDGIDGRYRVRRKEPEGRVQTHPARLVSGRGDAGSLDAVEEGYRRRNRPDTGLNCQVQSGVEPSTRTTGYGCQRSIARPVSPVDIASALTGIADAGVRPPLCLRPLPGAGHCLPPL